jgi:hypothetical protein
MKTYGKVATIVAALAALALSGTALAKHKEGHDKGNGQGPKSSIEVVNLCEPVQKNGMDEEGKFLMVKSTITNETGDGVDEPLTISQVSVGGLQFVKSEEPPKKKEWKEVGPLEYTDNAGLEIPPFESKDYITYLDICGSDKYPLSENATALNAEVQIMIDDRNFVGKCDDDEKNNNYDANGNLIYDPELDESRIDIEDYPWLGCP